MILIFVFWDFSFKVYNNVCIMPSFGKNIFSLFLISAFKINDTVNLEDNLLYIFSCYQTIIFHSKSVILIVFCLVLTNSLFTTLLTQWFMSILFRSNCNYFHTFLVLMYMSLLV